MQIKQAKRLAKHIQQYYIHIFEEKNKKKVCSSWTSRSQGCFPKEFQQFQFNLISELQRHLELSFQSSFAFIVINFDNSVSCGTKATKTMRYFLNAFKNSTRSPNVLYCIVFVRFYFSARRMRNNQIILLK